MPIHVPQWFVIHRFAAWAVGFLLLISDFNAVLASVSLLLLSVLVETVFGSLVTCPEALIQAKLMRSCVFFEERRLFVRENRSHFNRPDVSLAV